jgi:hypothetical protein
LLYQNSNVVNTTLSYINKIRYGTICTGTPLSETGGTSETPTLFIFYFYNAYFINSIFLFISDLLSASILSTMSDLVAKSQHNGV